MKFMLILQIERWLPQYSLLLIHRREELSCMYAHQQANIFIEFHFLISYYENSRLFNLFYRYKVLPHFVIMFYNIHSFIKCSECF